MVMLTAIDAIRCGWSMTNVDTAFFDGIMIPREYHRFHRLWCWSAVRWGGNEGKRHERLYDRNKRQYNARIERCKNVLLRVMKNG